MRTRKNYPPRKAAGPDGPLARRDSEDNRNLAFNFALRYLSFRNRSTKEVYDYLIRKNFVDETINVALKRLVDLKFINDEEFARLWIESRQKHKGKSKFILKSELRMKGLKDDQIQPLLNEAQEDFETAKIAYDKKKRILGNLPSEEFKKKMAAFLQRRGYSWEVVSKLLKVTNED